MPVDNCHICGSCDLFEVLGYRDLQRVTSDCRPWRKGGRIAVCQACSTVQKVITAEWRREADEIYAGYQLYAQSATGTEQYSFDPSNGFGQPRSTTIIQAVSEHFDLTGNGRFLDLGCGVGVTLRSVHALAPNWRLEGFDPNIKDRKSLEALSGVVAVHDGDLEALLPGFDVISCFHVLEHIVSPLDTLRKARELLSDQGVLVVQVPYFHDNAFDLTIADHCTHFSKETLTALVTAAGLDVRFLSVSVVRREITMVAARGGARKVNSPDYAAEAELVSAALAWLTDVVRIAKDESRNKPFGIFGSSIAGVMAGASLDGAFDFFVDEDPTRIGSYHMGKPILPPSAIPPDATVVVPMMPTIAAAVAERLAGSLRNVTAMPSWREGAVG
jgi:2-polyprenyl-3-methyl-5-hydroxy-6-metoxy-1,4-benzoquinol methylase